MLRAITTLRRKSDYRRWSNPKSLHARWEPRTRMVAALIPDHSRVIEFGAGNRLLEKYLDPSCTYTPSDMVDRGPGTIVCDLNEHPLPDLGVGNYDVAVLIGVIEYVRDIPALLDWLTQYVSTFVLACAPATTRGYSLRALREAIERLGAGWMNDYQEDELVQLFAERGYSLAHDDNWEDQRLYVFAKANSPAT